MTTHRRRRIAAGALALVVAAAVAVAIVLALRGSAGPDEGAARLVPADALAYVSVSTDDQRGPVRRALALARGLPSFSLAGARLLARVAAIAGGSGSAGFADLTPWLGDEAAFAVLDTSSGTAQSLIVLRVADARRARSFLAREGAAPAGSYRGTALERYRNDTALAFLGGFLLVGPPAGVEAAIDVARGARSLAADPGYQRASAGEPSDRVIDAYLSAAGLRRILEPRSGLLGALAALVDRTALTGLSLAVSPASGGVAIRVHSVLDPTLARLSGQPRVTFTPTLASAIPGDATLLLDTSGFPALVPRILTAGRVAGIAGQLGPLLGRLGAALRAEGVDVHRVVSLFSGETAVALLPSVSPGGRASLVIVAPTRDPAAARTTLAELEVPLAQLFAPPASGPGEAPEFNDRQVGNVTAHQLSLAPGLSLAYAVLGDRVVVSSSLDGIAALLAGRAPLTRLASYRAVLATRPAQVSSLLFLNFSQLLSLGEQTGLTRGTAFTALRPDLQRIRAVGLSSTGGEADTTAELFLQIP